MADITIVDSIETEWPTPDMAELGHYMLSCMWAVTWPALAVLLSFLAVSHLLG